MSPLNYALQYEMSKKLSKLLYTVDDDIMSVEPLIGDSNYNSIATIRRNGKITRVKYNRKKLDDTLAEICLTKLNNNDGTTSYTCLTPFVTTANNGSLPDNWDDETTKDYLKSYGVTWDRTLGKIIDTSDKVFNMVGTRSPIGVFDIAKGIKKSDGDAYIIHNVENNQPFGVVGINYGEQVSFKVPFNSKYTHAMYTSNGSIAKKIGLINHRDINDDKAVNIEGYGDTNNPSLFYSSAGIGKTLKPVIIKDSTVTYTVRYDNNGVSVSITDDTRTIPIDIYEMLTDKVFVCLSFAYEDPIPSPLSQPDINIVVNKQNIESLPEYSTAKFQLPKRFSGTYEYDSNGVATPVPFGWGGFPKKCLFGYATLPGSNRIKFFTETEQAFNSQYVSKVTIGLDATGGRIDDMLPYIRFVKQTDGTWTVLCSDRLYQSISVTDAELKNIDVIYDSIQRYFLVYAATDPNDTSALDTENVEKTPSTILLMDNRNVNIEASGIKKGDLVVEIEYKSAFDRIPIIKTTRYKPEPSKTSFDFVNAIYTTIGDKCTTHYGSTTYPVTFAKRLSLEITNDFELGYYKVDAMANIIGNEDVFVMGLDTDWGNLPNRRRLIITTERLTVADLMAEKYQGVVITYSGVETVESGDTGIVKYNKREMINTLPAVFTLKESTNDDGNSQSDIDRVPQMLQLLGDESNQHALYQLMVDISATEYFIYDIRQDYAYNPAEQQT